MQNQEVPVLPPSEVDPPKADPLTAVSETIHEGANSLSNLVRDFVSRWDLPGWLESALSGTILFLLVVLLAFLVFFFVRPIVRQTVIFLFKRSSVTWDDPFIITGVACWLSHLISALLLIAVIPGLLGGTPEVTRVFLGLAQIYLIVSGAFIFTSILDGARHLYEDSDINRKIPVTTLVQVLRLLSFLVALVLIVATVAGKSPVVFLSGLGVFTSILMLIFKDSILGFVAGIQLTSNNMVSKGDWIEMPRYGADGDVMEVGLTTVKVLNWDKTITTIPTYALISDSFKNWRSMPECGGRRIKRSILIDMKSVKLCSPEMLDRFRRIQFISEYIDAKLEDIDLWNRSRSPETEASLVNGRRLTNLGTFRAYIEAYLRNHPGIHQKGMTLLVRQLDPGPTGVPIEIYCFTNITSWVEYEMIQSDIFDHFLAVVSEFDLEVFQNPSRMETNIQLHGLRHSGADMTQS